MDGFRLLFSTVDGVKSYTRHGNDVTERFPKLKVPLVSAGTILDGELVVIYEGQPDFKKVTKRLMTTNPRKVQRWIHHLMRIKLHVSDQNLSLRSK